MPIDIDPTSTAMTKTTTFPFVADKLYVDRLVIDESNRPANDADVYALPPSIDLVATPYAVDADGNRTYAAAGESIKSINAYALAAIVPEVGAAMLAIFAATAAVRRRVVLNAQALAAAEAVAASAADDLAAATAARESAESARADAYAARESIEDKESQAWADAQAAFFAADATWNASSDAIAAPQAAVDAATARVEIAKAAVADPANPPLTEATE